MAMVTEKAFIKKAQPGKLRKLYQLLSAKDEAWKALVCHIPRRDGRGPRFSTDDVDMFERAKLPGEAVIDAWSTDRPNLGQLRDVLYKAQLIRLAEFVRVEILGEKPKPNDTCTLMPVQASPTSNIDTRRETENDPTITLKPGKPQAFSYDLLASWCKYFDDKHVSTGGCLLGSGGFGKVFLGNPPGDTPYIAIKQLDMKTPLQRIQKQFAAEINTLSSYVHENLVGLYGYSYETHRCCIVYEYMPNGSVETRLACKNEAPPLTVSQRLHIIRGAARGLNHLHTAQSTPIIHRDIKTANILLDEYLNAKLGDFGLARLGPHTDDKTHTLTENIIGTTLYMAPEYSRGGKVSTKLDSYSFGVVLLEILTGLPAYDKEREDMEDIITYMENVEDSVIDLVDKKAGEWPEQLASDIFKLAMEREDCLLESNYKKRSSIEQVLPEIEAWKI